MRSYHDEVGILQHEAVLMTHLASVEPGAEAEKKRSYIWKRDKHNFGNRFPLYQGHMFHYISKRLHSATKSLMPKTLTL